MTSLNRRSLLAGSAAAGVTALAGTRPARAEETPGVTATEIFSGQAPAAPATAQRFLERLAQVTHTAVRGSPVPQADTPAASATQPPNSAAPSTEPPRTYPLEQQK